MASHRLMGKYTKHISIKKHYPDYVKTSQDLTEGQVNSLSSITYR